MRSNKGVHGIAIERFYKYVGLSRQGFHKRLRAHKKETDMMHEIAEEVKDYRKRKDRRAGSRSIFYNLNIKYRYGIGVTKFEQLMSKHGLTLLPLRVRVIDAWLAAADMWVGPTQQKSPNLYKIVIFF